MSAILGRRTIAPWAALLALAVGAASFSCASKWTMRSAPSPIALQWPYQPAKAKLTFLESLTGVSQQKGSQAAFKAFVYGRDRGERNAFVLPVAVAAGGDGRIAVADLGRRCVHLFIPATQRYLRLTGGKNATLVSPVAVAFDEELRLYVSDSAGRIFSFGADGELRFTSASAGEEALRRPTGLAYSPTKKLLYVVDTLANKVHAFDTDGKLAFSFGERGDEANRFNFPTHIFRTRTGELFVTNTLAFRVEIFDEDGKPLGSFGRHGDGSGDLAMPKGIAVDKDGVVYVVDGLFDNVQLFDRRGAFLLTLGRRGTDSGEFWLPSGAFIDDNDKLYVCDTYNRRIQVFRIAERYAETAF
jgi:DNA-binding beta-propeller fold protein YncE